MPRGPSERGYRSVMLTQREYDELAALRDETGLSSLTSALRRLMDERQRPSGGVSQEDLDAALLFAGVTGRPAQKLRDWFGV